MNSRRLKYGRSCKEVRSSFFRMTAKFFIPKGVKVLQRVNLFPLDSFIFSIMKYYLVVTEGEECLLRQQVLINLSN